MKKEALRIFGIAMLAILLPVCPLVEKASPNNDMVIANIVALLRCPALISDMSDDTFCSDAPIRAANVELVDTWAAEDKTAEVYRGPSGGLLAILRKGDNVYCAQYINTTSTSEFWLQDVYEAVGDGMYCKTRIAFFDHGGGLRFIYYRPDAWFDVLPENDAECIMTTKPQT